MERKLHFPTNFPILNSNRIKLSAMHSEDAKELYEIRANKEFSQYLSSEPYRTIKEAEDLIAKNTTAFANKEAISWKVSLNDSDKLIGYIGFWRMDKANFRAEVGFGIDNNFRNKGFITEALDLILDFGFNQMNFHSIMADTDPLNKASIKVLEKIGFKKEAHIRENYYFRGKFIDSYYFGLLESKFQSNF